MSTYPFQIGDVCRLSFKWPQDARSERGDGSKERHSAIFSTKNGSLWASPISTVRPEPHEEKYAIKLSGMMKRQLGLDATRESWLKANYINLVDTPSPAIRKWAKRGDDELKFCLGKMPQGLLDAMKEKRELAIAEKAVRIEHIQKHDPQRELSSLKKHASSPRSANDAAGGGSRRYLPGDPGRHSDRLQRVQGAAQGKHARKIRLQNESRRPSSSGCEI